MTRSTAMIELGSSSMSLISSRKATMGDDHFRWQSIKKFLYFACTFSSSVLNFDVFSKVCHNVRITDFILIEATVGIAYMCMDGFIKQYTKRFDCNKFLNPLLRGISYGRFTQTALFAVLHATYLADSMRFLVVSFREIPPWAICAAQEVNASICVTQKDIYLRCRANISTDFFTTSAYLNYLDTFRHIDRNTLTTSFFVLGLVWLLTFFIASVSEETIVKIFRLAFVFRLISTIVTLVFLFISTDTYIAKEAFSQMVDITAESDFMESFRHVVYAFGIGFLGIYDFGAISAFTMIDTAVVIFAVSFTMFSFLRSMIVKMLYLVMARCVTLNRPNHIHFLFFAILPLSTDFIYAHKLYVFYLYGNLLIGALVYMTNLVLILAKFLSYEFRSVKLIYIVGLLCCVGLAFSILFLGVIIQSQGGQSLTSMDLLATALGGFYVAIVMWLYGLKRFCTDIQFWLAFRPTRFWTIIWSILPVILFSITIRHAYEISLMPNSLSKTITVGWIATVLGLVAIINVKITARFLMQNNIAGVFKSSKSYGPPEAEDRKRRLYYSEYTRQRKCKHHCLVLDEWFDCNHLATSARKGEGSTSSSEISLMNLYDSKTTSRLRSVGTLSTAPIFQT